jgi:hypothetical protein
MTFHKLVDHSHGDFHCLAHRRHETELHMPVQRID